MFDAIALSPVFSFDDSTQLPLPEWNGSRSNRQGYARQCPDCAMQTLRSSHHGWLAPDPRMYGRTRKLCRPRAHLRHHLHLHQRRHPRGRNWPLTRLAHHDRRLAAPHHRYCLLGAPSCTLASAFSGAGAILTADGTTRSRNQKTTTWFTIKSGTYTVRINQATPTWKDGKPTTTPLYMANNRSANPTMLSSQTSGRANPGRSRSTRAVSKAKTAVKTSP